jgi:hypothetical protein
MKYLVLILAMLTSFNALAAKELQAKTYQDYSGVYTCTGDDAHEGKYTGTVTMTLKPEHSHDSYASYDFKLVVPEYGTYLGHAAANGNNVAMHFALQDQATKDYGTGIAKMTKNAKGQWSFHKFYFEPEFKGGNTGLEDCIKK